MRYDLYLLDKDQVIASLEASRGNRQVAMDLYRHYERKWFDAGGPAPILVIRDRMARPPDKIKLG